MGTSTFSEYTVVHEQSVAKVDKAAPLDKVRAATAGHDPTAGHDATAGRDGRLLLLALMSVVVGQWWSCSSWWCG